jgi:hypothetical protein
MPALAGKERAEWGTRKGKSLYPSTLRRGRHLCPGRGFRLGRKGYF